MAGQVGRLIPHAASPGTALATLAMTACFFWKTRGTSGG